MLSVASYKHGMSDALQRWIERLEREPAPWRSFAARAQASDRLEALQQGPTSSALQLRAARLQARLDACDERFVRRVRERLRRGRYTPRGMIQAFWRHAATDAQSGYDALDVLLASLLDAGELPAEHVARDAEMVAYQPAPGRAILQLLPHVGAKDSFYDLGSGLGRVVILVALLCGARACGVEIEPEFCAYAERAARAVNARGTTFIAADAREVALDDGTFFFLYTPFRGALLGNVLAQLRAVAARGPIRIATFGPCTPEVAREPWLALRDGVVARHELAVFHSL